MKKGGNVVAILLTLRFCTPSDSFYKECHTDVIGSPMMAIVKNSKVVIVDALVEH